MYNYNINFEFKKKIKILKYIYIQYLLLYILICVKNWKYINLEKKEYYKYFKSIFFLLRNYRTKND